MGSIKRHQKVLFLVITASLIAAAGTLYYLKTSPAAVAVGFRAAVITYMEQSGFPRRPDMTAGLDVIGETVWVDGAAGVMPDKPGEHDVKVSYKMADGQVFCDYTTGFCMSLPDDMTADVSHSPKFMTFQSPGAKIVVSRERAVGRDTSDYIAYYFYRFVLSDAYRAANRITLLDHTVNDDYERLSVHMDGYAGVFDTYTFLDFKTGGRAFYHVMIKSASGDPAAAELSQRVADSFGYFKPEGKAVWSTDYRPELPTGWTAGTRAMYEQIASSDSVLWGIFTKDVTGNGIEREIPALEDKLGYQFEIVLAYTGLNGGFPTAFMERCAGEGRIVELTLQTTTSNNLDLYGASPWLDFYRTGDDARIRAFARDAKAFGKPFLFRLNNEMNSDWVSYGGVTNLLDPDICVENWRTVYRIFEEEGVDNAVWIFNPNDRDAPPNAWNCPAAYYPGNAYVQLLGVTGYNNGTYYHDTWGESWRGFREIYDNVQSEAGAIFGKFPWIITEFSSSSIGGDKVKWIDGMFENFWRYPNIKAAVWFSHADFDIRDGVTPSRPYWLDETDETRDAFRRGLEKTGKILPAD